MEESWASGEEGRGEGKGDGADCLRIGRVKRCKFRPSPFPSNTFAVKNAQGVPKTMFKPKDGAVYFHNQK